MYDNQNPCTQSQNVRHNVSVYSAEPQDEEQHYGKGKSPAPPNPKR